MQETRSVKPVRAGACTAEGQVAGLAARDMGPARPSSRGYRARLVPRSLPHMADAFEVPPRERIWQVVAAIPAGRVATYGGIAALAGVPRGARYVGSVLRDLPAGSRLPWHRVLNAGGRLSVDPVTAREQRERLESEGVAFVAGRVDLGRYGWV